MRWDLAAWWRLGEALRSLFRSVFPTPPMPLVSNASSLSFSSTVVINSLDLVSSAPDLDLSVSYMVMSLASSITLPMAENRARGAEALVNQLQRSLSETLTLFYPFAGRYTAGSLFVDCNDAGAEFLEARVRAASTLSSYLISAGEFETELQNQLVSGFFQ